MRIRFGCGLDSRIYGIYVHIKHKYTIPYMYLTDGGNLSHKKMQYHYSKERFSGRVKQIRIIGQPDNERPDKWSSTVLAASQEGLFSSGTDVTNGSAYLSVLSVNLQITGCHD